MLYVNPTDNYHAIVADDEGGNEVVLPFCLSGVNSMMNMLPLTTLEFDKHEYIRIELTSNI